MTEKEWKLTPEYIGGGQSEMNPGRFIVLEWDDLTETPTECVVRLNAEAMEYQALYQGARKALEETQAKLAAIKAVL